MNLFKLALMTFLILVSFDYNKKTDNSRYKFRGMEKSAHAN